MRGRGREEEREEKGGLFGLRQVLTRSKRKTTMMS